jgi:quinol monooxygenase YgiN
LHRLDVLRKLAAPSNEEAAMHARVTSIAGQPDQIAAGIENFRANVAPFTHENGGKGSLFLVDRETGDIMSITLWESAEALAASDERANALRAQAASTGQSSETPVVGRYEVAVYEL